MSVVVAFVSQKGGVGKSTLARALVTSATKAGLTAKLADLDVQQRTVVAWDLSRQRHNVRPVVRVDAFANAAHALEIAASDEDLLILDMPGHVTDGTTEVARHSDLLIQPTSPSADDLPISLLVFEALERLGIPRYKLAFALCRVLSRREEKAARSHLVQAGYTVLKGSIFEHLRYREAMNIGRSIGETGKKALDARAHVLIGDLLDKATLGRREPWKQTSMLSASQSYQSSQTS
jgi:chromosome partitioning protein